MKTFPEFYAVIEFIDDAYVVSNSKTPITLDANSNIMDDLLVLNLDVDLESSFYRHVIDFQDYGFKFFFKCNLKIGDNQSTWPAYTSYTISPKELSLHDKKTPLIVPLYFSNSLVGGTKVGNITINFAKIGCTYYMSNYTAKIDIKYYGELARSLESNLNDNYMTEHIKQDILKYNMEI